MGTALNSSTEASGLRRALGLGDLILFNLSAVVGIRWLAAAAQAGPGSVTLWILAGALFFVPSALAVAALSARFPEEGGIYVWTRQAFGGWHGFLCGWCYWLSNLFYFPSLLMSGVAMAAAALGFAENKALVVSLSLTLLWIALLTNLVGLSIGKWTNSMGGVTTYLAGGLIVIAGLLAWMHSGPATPMHFLPQWSMGKLNFWSQIAFAFAGLELGSIMAGEIRDPARTVPRAAWISGAYIAGFYILGTLALLALIPSDQVNILTGLVQVGQAAGARLGMPLLTTVLVVLVLAATTGGAGSWIAGTARLPFVIGVDRYLPPVLARIHPRWHTPHVSLLAQGAACTLFLVVLQAGENLRNVYQLLVDITVITYFIPFIYMFAAAWREGLKLSGLSGLFVTVVAIGLSLVPPPEVAAVWLFELKVAGGCALLVLAAKFCFYLALKRQPAQ